MKLVIIFGAGAVGKMTVGQELAKITDLRLFHNHMTIEPVIEIFGRFELDVILRLRDVIFEEFAGSHHYGMIFTCVWALDDRSDWEHIGRITEIFGHEGAEIYYAELVASQEVRLQRNTTENRLKHKASKRNIEFSRYLLLSDDEKHRLESHEGEIPFPNYIKIDNTHLLPEEVARMIKDRFSL